MAAYGSTTSIMVEKIKQLQTEIVSLVKERDGLEKELKAVKKDGIITTKSETVGPKPNRERTSVKIPSKKKNKKKS